ncbi:MAG: GNAT family N-acetyltransferase [Corynebacterium sp.]|uniref:GNAT family N-acetyltransferase n=1 Tax=Corynebacterium sp. TaxID=1720 RepID=UPI0026DDC259|nr:GNAT family N-acetyltransferase [Corynebacterium sp.]MDO5097553.1 GNAT family N-acetyltransferase [Corynebacterium sp.]
MIRSYKSAGQVPGWAEASNTKGGFYLSPCWLESADSDGVSTPAYFHDTENAPSVFLAAHYSPEENNSFYHPGLILGGRRGYLSPLLGNPSDDSLRVIVDHACKHFNTLQYTWPYLPPADAVRVHAALGGNLSFAGAHCLIDVDDCSSLDDFISRFDSKQRRTNARRELRRFQESNLSLRRCTLGEPPATPEVLGPLLGQVQRGYGHDHSDSVLTDLLRRQRDSLGEDSVVFLATDEYGVCAFSLCFRYGDSLYVRLVGFDRSRIQNAGAYGVLAIYEPVDFAIEEGLDTVYLGMESFEAKVRRGARVESLWTVSPQPIAAVDISRILGELPAREASMLEQVVAKVTTNENFLPE